MYSFNKKEINVFQFKISWEKFFCVKRMFLSVSKKSQYGSAGNEKVIYKYRSRKR